MTELTLTTEIIVVLALVAFTIFLFVSEIVRVDVAAILVLVLLGLLGLIPESLLEPISDPRALFDGFASNAVISIIAVMIIGQGLDKTGLMSHLAAAILRIGGATERRIIPLISGAVGGISSFMQNVGAAALFLPVVSRISVRTGLPLSRLLMPMGFAAILGGTITMVGSSPLIMLNDLIATSNEALAARDMPTMESFGLFAVTPVGLALLATGILYFVLFGRFVLPAKQAVGTRAQSTLDHFREIYGIDYSLYEAEVSDHSAVIGKSVAEIERSCQVRILAIVTPDTLQIAPTGETSIPAGATIGVMATESALDTFFEHTGIRCKESLDLLSELLAPTRAGIGELVIPPGSALIGRSGREIGMRGRYGLSLIALHRDDETVTHGTDDIRDLPFKAGDTLVCHTSWEALARLEKDRDFVVVTSDYPHEELRPAKVPYALAFFLIALGLILFTDLRLSIALLTGAIGMILTRVLTIDEAYASVDWKTVFLLASLLPLGAAVENSGAAAWIAQETLELLGTPPAWVIQAAIALLATLFTLVMSNVGATALLVPLAVNIAIAAQAQGIDADPAIMALTVGIATSNSFILPTHQVNALLMGPAGYRVGDYLRAGGIMTLLFLLVSLTAMNLLL